MRKPNILLITTDSQRCDSLRCMGSQHALSPSLDRLAAEGVLFEQAHTSSPVCAPARCSLLTGLHTPVHGCIENGVRRRSDLPVFPDALAEQGYTNVLVGKAHFDPIPQSFHACHPTRGEKGGEVDDFYAEHVRRHGFRRSSAHPNPIPPELFIDAYIADVTIREISAVVERGKAPFFAFCSMLSPHSPMDPPGEWATIMDGATLPPINYTEGEIERQPRSLRYLVGTLPDSPRFDEATYSDGPFASVREAVGNTIERADAGAIDLYRRLYYGSCAYCDAQVGRLLDYLDSSGLREDTLVIFSSDHGLQLFDHGFNDKHNFYDGSWRVPLIMSMPGTLREGTRSGFAIWNDVTATILAAAGAPHRWVQGFDLFGPLKNGAPSPRKAAVASIDQSLALATERWKIEYHVEEATGRLYDRRNDACEQRDLYDCPDFRELRDALLRALLTWRADLVDVNRLASSTKGGGPVARRVAEKVRAMEGSGSEERLQRNLEDFLAAALG